MTASNRFRTINSIFLTSLINDKENRKTNTYTKPLELTTSLFSLLFFAGVGGGNVTVFFPSTGVPFDFVFTFAFDLAVLVSDFFGGLSASPVVACWLSFFFIWGQHPQQGRYLAAGLLHFGLQQNKYEHNRRKNRKMGLTAELQLQYLFRRGLQWWFVLGDGLSAASETFLVLMWYRYTARVCLDKNS